MRAKRPVLGLALVLAVGQAQQGPPLFSTAVSSVRVDAEVMTNQLRVEDLHASDFNVFESGRPVRLAGFAHEELPIDVVLVCQLPLRGPAWRGNGPGVTYGFALSDASVPLRLMNAAADAVVSSRPGDRVAIVSYGTDPRIDLRFTNDRKAIAAAIKRFGDAEHADANIVTSSEALAIEYAVRMIEEAERGDAQAQTERRRLIVTISNVFGTGAGYAAEPIIRELWNRDIVLSTITDLTPNASTRSVQSSGGGDSQAILFRRYNPVHIAQATGGDRILGMDPAHPADLLAPVRERYTLWFDQPPGAAPGELRSIRVDLSEEARRRLPRAVVRAREGYVAH